MLLDGRQEGQRTTEEERRRREKDLKRQLTQFRNNVHVCRSGMESVFGEHIFERYQNPDHRPSIEAGIRKNVVGVPSQLSDPRGFRCSLIRICDVLQEWDEDADACRAAGKRFASAHATTLSFLEIAAAELNKRDALYGDLSFIHRVREQWGGLARRS